MNAPPPVRVCRSNVHTEPVPAVVVGTFDVSAANPDARPEPDSAYCLRCGAALHAIGYFFPGNPADAAELTEHFDVLTRTPNQQETP